jgi:hypothetical protein
MPSGGVGGAAAAAGASGSDATVGMCVKGQVKASEVVFIGTSVIAAGTTPQETAALARTAGTIGASESYRSYAQVGAELIPTGGTTIQTIPSQFMTAASAGAVKVVLMEGGINDLEWGGACAKGADDAACMQLVVTVQTLFKTMKDAGVKEVVYFFYPDPSGSMGAALVDAANTLRPKMKAACDGSTDVHCVWVDLRDSWKDHYAMYTSDGIHPTAAGSKATAQAVWDAMVKNCVAQ